MLTYNGVATARIPSGVEIKENSEKALSFSFSNAITTWDTLQSANGDVLLPHVDAGRIRQSPDGTIVQWVISFNVNIPNPRGFALTNVAHTTEALALPLCVSQTPDGVVVPTLPPLSEPLSIEYSGIAREQYLATVYCVVAETRNGVTSICKGAGGRIEFAPAALGPSTRRSSLFADVVNPRASFRVASASKNAERVQGQERLGNVYGISIESEGVYRLTADQLRSAGIATDATAARTLHIYGRGGIELSEAVEPANDANLLEQPIIVQTNDDGSIREVIFYASGDGGFAWGNSGAAHYIHHYATHAGYLLSVGGADGMRITQRHYSDVAAQHRPLTVKGYVYNEEELVNPYSSGSGRKWLGRSVENGGSLSYTTALPGLVRSGDVSYKMVVAHKGTETGTMTVFENGTAFAQRTIKAIPKYMDTYSVATSGSVPASSIAGDGKSTLRFDYNCPDQVATGLLDWFEIAYPRGMIADNNEFGFFSDPTAFGIAEYTVNGFGSSEIYGFDVTDRGRPVRVQNSAPSGGLFGIREQFDSGVIRRYYITSTVQNASLRQLTFANLRADSRNTDVIVITNSALRESAQRFADYRTANSNLTVSVVTTEEIFNEFSYGVQDPAGIRNFVQNAFSSWTTKPRYVVLWGDGHFDYKGLTTSAPNYIIPYESLDPDDAEWGLNTFTTDDFYVRVVGQDAQPDLAIGRMPVESNSQGDVLSDRIKAYEHTSNEDDWRTRVGLIADDGATTQDVSDGSIHLTQSEALANFSIPQAVQTKKIYLVEYPTENVARGRRKPSVTAEYVSTINTTGLLLLNWIGHGNPRVWAHEFVFERETTPPQMTNDTKLFFLTAATCDFARFDLTETQSGAEEMVLMKNGGAVGTFSASRVVFSFDNAEINAEFYKQLFSKETDGSVPLLGDVMFRVKQKLHGANDEKFFLMGDPTMRLLIPNYNLNFESINGQLLNDTTDITIAALSTVTVTGYISKPLEKTVDVSFNGVATITLLDATKTVTVTDTDKYNTVNSFTMPGAALSRGSYNVVDGRFTATFVIPKDISFSTSQARLYGYAINVEKQTAIGTTNSVIVDGVSTDSYDDVSGPAMNIFMDSRYFHSGDVVRINPILIVDLEDKTGINTTGVGVGHDIEAQFDDGELIEILTSNFSTSLENPRAGTASKQIFGLRSGTHNVRVRAWDVLNNMSEANTVFRIATSDEGIVTSWVMNYPNPFADFTTIRFQHNTPQAFEADIRIYDMQGRMVSSDAMTIKDMQTAEFVWDGRDSEGSVLGTGVYVCNVRITDQLGNVSDVAGKLALIR